MRQHERSPDIYRSTFEECQREAMRFAPTKETPGGPQKGPPSFSCILKSGSRRNVGLFETKNRAETALNA